MAEELELLLKVSKEGAEKDLDRTTKQILDLKKQQKQLDTLLKEGAITQVQYSKSTTENKIKLGELTAEQKTSIRTVKASAGSMKELGNELLKNKREYQNLTKEERENEQIGGKLLKTIQAQDAEFKDLSKSIGQTQGNVGNYKDAINEAISENQHFGQVNQIWGGLQRGLATARMGFSTLKGAIASTGVGLLIIGFSSLYSWFQRTEKGAQTLRVITAGVGQVFESLMDLSSGLGESIYNTFSNPKEAVISLWDTVKTNIINRFMGLIDTFKFGGAAIKAALNLDWEGVKENAALAGESILQATTGIDDLPGKVKNGVESAKKAIKDLYSEIKEDVEGAVSLQERENALRVAKREFLKEEALLESQIAEAKLKASDQTLSNTEREKALSEAVEKQKNLTAEKVALGKEELAIKRERNALSDSTEADLEMEAQLEADLIRLRKDGADKQKEMFSMMSGLQKAEAERLKVEEEKKQKAEEERIEKEKEQLQAFNDYKKDLESEIYEQGLETDEERAAFKLEKAKEKELEKIKAMGLLKEQENELLLALDQKYAEQSNVIAEEATKVKKELAVEETKSKISGVNDALGAVANAAGEETLFGKGAAIASTTMSTYESAQKSYSSLSGIPVIGPVLGVAAAGAAIAAGLMRVGKISGISTPKPPKAQFGGYVGGQLHSNGGTMIEAEKGEFIVNRNTMSNPGMASSILAMNAAGNAGQTGGSAMLTEERVAQIAASVVKSVPVSLVESEVTDSQKKVKVREQKFSV